MPRRHIRFRYDWQFSYHGKYDRPLNRCFSFILFHAAFYDHQCMCKKNLLILNIKFTFLFQCYTSWKLYLYAGIESKPISMTIISLIYSISLFIVCLCAFVSIQHHGSIFKYWDNEFRLNWSPNDDGYQWHCTATINEWIAINSMAFFFFIMSRRLRKFQHWDNVCF